MPKLTAEEVYPPPLNWNGHDFSPEAIEVLQKKEIEWIEE